MHPYAQGEIEQRAEGIALGSALPSGPKGSLLQARGCAGINLIYKRSGMRRCNAGGLLRD